MLIRTIAVIPAAALALGLAGPAGALETQRYVIDAAHTQVVFDVERFGFNQTIGTFTGVSGALLIDAEAPANSSVEAVVRADTLWSGDAARDEALRGAFWFGVEAYPEIRFVSTVVTLGDDEDTARVAGELTFRGVTRPVAFDMALTRLGPDPSAQGRESIGFSGGGEILRSAFGHTTAAALVGDSVSIRLEVLAHLEDEAAAEE